ncbi:MAG: hypothetical protein AWM53_00598 [Candidatus Dichloromethanomonas elyunquensis]|nr:MAG: hypothetical protein AWM53_00598 [Candidatus Dichloromethanomonas elyunquensis]
MAVKKSRNIQYMVFVFFVTFVVAVLLGGGTEAVLRFLPVSLTWIFLIIVIVTGIIFDIIGIAVTAADEAPHHARAAKKVFGAKQAVFLIKRSDKVANFANDIVGDITGTLSGAMGAAIVIRLANYYSFLDNWKVLLNILFLGVIASLTVTGKAWGKTFAIYQANRIVDITGRVIAGLEKYSGLNLTGVNKKGGK